MRKLLTILLILSFLTTNIYARINLDSIDTDPFSCHPGRSAVARRDTSKDPGSSTHGRTQSSLYKENKERSCDLPFSLDPHARELTLPAQDDAETLTTLQKFGDRLMRRGIEAGVSTSVHAAVTGRADLGQVGIQTVVKAVGDTLSGMAGDGKEGGSLSEFEHGAAHFGIGAAIGAITNPDDPFRAAMVAGTSAVVSHKMAEALAPDKPTGLVTEEELTAYNEGVERAANIGKFLTPTLAMLSGQGTTGVGASTLASSTAVDYNFHPHAKMELQQQAVQEEAKLQEALERSKLDAFEREGGAGGSGLTDAERQNIPVIGRDQYVLLESGEVVPTWKVADMDLESRATAALDDYRDGADRLLTMAEFTPHPGIAIPAALVRNTVDILSGNTTAGEAAAGMVRSLLPGRLGVAARIAGKGLPEGGGKGTVGAEVSAGASVPKVLKMEGGGSQPNVATPSTSNAGPSKPPAASSRGKTSLESLDLSQPKVHKNSLQYDGPTHVYTIKGPDGRIYKVGESAQGVRKRDGASIRAEQQARRLRKESGEDYETSVRRDFVGKQPARKFETTSIKKIKGIFGEDALPGNKVDR